jgi:hypothetical protein
MTDSTTAVVCRGLSTVACGVTDLLTQIRLAARAWESSLVTGMAFGGCV